LSTANAGRATTEHEAGYVGAANERVEGNIGDIVGKRDTSQVGAILELLIGDEADAVRKRDGFQIAATEKCSVADIGDTIGNRNAGQTAAIKRLISNLGDTGWDGEVRQFHVANKAPFSNGGDRKGDIVDVQNNREKDGRRYERHRSVRRAQESASSASKIIAENIIASVAVISGNPVGGLRRGDLSNGQQGKEGGEFSEQGFRFIRVLRLGMEKGSASAPGAVSTPSRPGGRYCAH